MFRVHNFHRSLPSCDETFMFFCLFVDRLHTVFFYKNIVYKNIEAQICLKFKNILRIYLSLISNTRVYYLPSFFEYMHVSLVLVNSFLASRSFMLGRSKEVKYTSYYVCMWVTTKAFLLFLSTLCKNILRIIRASKWKKVKNIEPQIKKQHSYKKKVCI